MSKSIHIENYEEFALDFIEGTLSPEMHRSFEAFLLLHPAIAEEIESMQAFELPALDAELSEEFKQNLKIEITPTAGIDESNYEESFALAVDKDLNPELAKNTLRFVDANPALASDYIAYQRTKVQPDLSVVYTDKSALKQPISLWAAYRTPIMRVAAAVTLIVGISSALRFSNEEIYQPRSGNQSNYASIEIDPLSTLPAQSINSVIENSSPEKLIEQGEKVLLAQSQPSNLKTENKVEQIDAINVNRVKQNAPDMLPEERYIADFPVQSSQPSTEALKENTILADAASNGKATVLNLTQFIGQKLFGIEPKKAETTKDLLREGFNTLADRSELVAVTRENDDHGSKRSLAIAGGRFEFTQVAHR